MAISSTQITDYLYKKVGFGVTKTDTSTAKFPFNESVASPLLVPGASILQQDFAIPNISSAPSANTVLNGSTIVSVYNTSTSAVVQGTSLSESIVNETWSTGLTNWIPPSFGSGYQLKVYAGAPGASAATAATYTSLPVAGSGNADSWFFDYQSGVLNFADTNVPTAAANVSNVVYFMGAVYTGTLGITNYANLNITGNLTSVNGNLVLTNGNIYAQNYYGTFQGAFGGGTSIGIANVAYYDQITPLTTNQTFYLEFSNTASAGNSITGVVSTVNVNPSTSTLSALAFVGANGTFTGTVIANAVNAATIGNTGAVLTGTLSTAAQTNITSVGTLTGLTVAGTEAVTTVNATNVNSATIGNTGAAITGATVTASTSVTTPTVTATTVNAATIGNASAALSGATGTFTGTVIASTLNAATIGNTGAVHTGSTGTFTTSVTTPTVTASTVNAATIGNTGAVVTGATLNTSGTATVNSLTSNGAVLGTTATFNTVNAATIGNASAALSGASLSLNGTDNNGIAYTNGALQITGGAGISGNLYVQGNVYAGNLISTQTQILQVNDPLLYLYASNPTTYNYEIGFYSHFGPYSGVSYQHTGLARDHNDNVWKLFSNAAEPSNGTVSFTNAIYDTLKLGNIVLANTQNATSTTTGVLQVGGGVGVAQSVWAGGYYTTGSAYLPTIYSTNVNAATIGNAGAALSGATGTFTGTVIANAVNAATIGNASAALSGATGTFTGTVIASTVNAATIGNASAALSGATGTFTGTVIAQTVNAATIGNTGAVVTGATGTFTTSVTTPTVTATTVNAATIGNTGAALSGATINLSSTASIGGTATVNALTSNGAVLGTTATFNTVNAATIGNASAALSGATGTFTGTVIASTLNAATIGNTGAVLTGATLNTSGTATVNSLTSNGSVLGTTAIFNTVNAATIGNTGAALTGSYAVTTANLTTATVLATTVNAATIGNTGAVVTGATGTFTTSVTTPTVTATTVNAATIGNASAALSGATGTFTGTVIAQTVNAATIGNTGATLIGTLSASNIAGTVATANVAIYANVLALSNNATFYPLLGNVTAGNTTTGTSTSLSYNPSTGNLSATAFIGNGQYLTNINPGAIGTVAVANVAYFVNETATTTNATFYPILGNTNAANGNSAAFTNSSLSYNPSSGQLSASSFSGAISSSMVTTALGYTPYNSTNPAGYQTSSGSVNSATYATQASTVAINAATTSSVYYPIFVPSNTTTAQYEYVDGNNYLQYNPGTGNLATKVLTATSNVFIGTPLNYTPANAPVQVGYNINNYSQFSIQNANNGNNASTDIAAVANNGSDNDTYVDMGIVSSTYNQAAYSLYKPNDGYLIVAGNTTTGGGNLILNTYQANDIVFATGGTTAKFEVARITSGNTVVVKSTNNNTLSANTGALQVWGGASISGNAYIGGSSYYMGGALFNHNQASAGATGGANQNAVIIQGVNDSTLLYAKPLSAYDAVIIGGNSASSSFAQGAKFIVNSTDSMLLPVGTSAQRPGSSGGTDTTGMLRYSTTTGAIEWYNGTTWATASTSFTVIADQQFTGTGSQTQFTLTNATTTAGTIVSINGVLQIPTLAYSVFTGNSQLVFTEAPISTDVIDVRTLTTTQTVTQLYDATGYNTVNTLTGTGITFTTGTSSATTQYTIDTNGGFVTNGSNVTIASAGTSTIDNLYANSYSSAKYTITATLSGTTIREVTEVLMVHNGSAAGAGSAYISSYGRVNTAGNTLVTYSGTTSGNIAQLQATTTNANTILRIKRDYIAL